jgi:hypothetical protein
VGGHLPAGGPPRRRHRCGRVGEFDGNEFGGGRVTLYAYGPDADALFAVMARFLREHPLRPASVTLRYGEPSDPQVRTAHVER